MLTMAPRKQADRAKKKAREKQTKGTKQKAGAKRSRRSGTAPTKSISRWRMRALEAERKVIAVQQEMEQKDERLKQVMAQYKMQQAECLMLRDELKIERHAHMLYMDEKTRQNQVLKDDEHRHGSGEVF